MSGIDKKFKEFLVWRDHHLKKEGTSFPYLCTCVQNYLQRKKVTAMIGIPVSRYIQGFFTLLSLARQLRAFDENTEKVNFVSGNLRNVLQERIRLPQEAFRFLAMPTVAYTTKRDSTNAPPHSFRTNLSDLFYAPSPRMPQ